MRPTCPTDGYIDPSQLTLALAEGARRRGAEIATGTRVTSVNVERGRVTGVETDRGAIEAEIVVNAGGMYAREIGALAGVNVPIVPMAHEYLITKPVRAAARHADDARPLAARLLPPRVGRPDHGRLRAPNCAPWGLDGIPADFNSRLLEEDWPRFEELMENAIVRVPTLAEMEVVKLINGPEAFTPDGEFILGPSDVRGFWVAAGFCAHGLAGAGGMGKLVAEWIVEGTPSLDVWHMDSRRFGAAYRSREYTVARTTEIYETYYDVKYPGHERSAGRPLRVSSAYSRLQELGAVFGEKSGWERANWFESNAAHGDESLRPRGWAGKLWSPAIGAEHVACRERAATLRRELIREARGLRRGRRRLPRVPVRQPRRPEGRRGHVHADAQPARRHRMRLHGHAPRARLASASSPAPPSASTTSRGSGSTRPRTARLGRRRHVGVRVLRALGAEGAGDPRSR